MMRTLVLSFTHFTLTAPCAISYSTSFIVFIWLSWHHDAFLRQGYLISFLNLCSFCIHNCECHVPLEIPGDTDGRGKLLDLSIQDLSSEFFQ